MASNLLDGRDCWRLLLLTGLGRHGRRQKSQVFGDLCKKPQGSLIKPNCLATANILVSRCAYLLSLQLALIEMHKPLFTKQSAYSNLPEVSFGIVRVAGVIQECARDFAGIGVEEVGHLFFQTVFSCSSHASFSCLLIAV
jgi:hypothetical protein